MSRRKRSLPSDVPARRHPRRARGSRVPDRIRPRGPRVLQLPCAAAAASAVTLRAIAASPDLRARYPRRSLINESGVRAANKLIAYIRVPRGRTVAGDDPTLRTARFGTPAEGQAAWPIGIPPRASVPVLSAGLVGLVGVPAAPVLALAVNASSAALQRRLELLPVLGLGRRKIVRLTALESLTLAMPSIALGAPRRRSSLAVARAALPVRVDVTRLAVRNYNSLTRALGNRAAPPGSNRTG